MKKCPNCNKKVIGHKNKKFCNSKCKDKFHNRNNPRGFYKSTNPDDNEHPHSDVALGQF